MGILKCLPFAVVVDMVVVEGVVLSYVLLGVLGGSGVVVTLIKNKHLNQPHVYYVHAF